VKSDELRVKSENSLIFAPLRLCGKKNSSVGEK
jgi:hypothetical protein